MLQEQQPERWEVQKGFFAFSPSWFGKMKRSCFVLHQTVYVGDRDSCLPLASLISRGISARRDSPCHRGLSQPVSTPRTLPLDVLLLGSPHKSAPGPWFIPGVINVNSPITWGAGGWHTFSLTRCSDHKARGCCLNLLFCFPGPKRQLYSSLVQGIN